MPDAAPPEPALTRFAIYAAPAAGSALQAFAARWLGRDPEDGAIHAAAAAAGLEAGRIAALTAEPRLYGFHGTLKPPFRLAQGRSEAELAAALAAFAAARPPLSIGRLEVAALGSFLALRPGRPCAALDQLAADCVRHFDGFRRAASEEELQRRRSAGLTARQERHLVAWGYPYVFEDFRLHFTLTGKVQDAAERALLLGYLQAATAEATEAEYRLEDICLFRQAGPGEPFRVAGRFRFSGSAQARADSAGR